MAETVQDLIPGDEVVWDNSIKKPSKEYGIYVGEGSYFCDFTYRDNVPCHWVMVEDGFQKWPIDATTKVTRWTIRF